MCLSKAYGYIPHDLLITKLQTYLFDKKSLNFLLDYLSRARQKTKLFGGALSVEYPKVQLWYL